MLAFIGPILVTATVFLLVAYASDYEKLGNGLAGGFFALLISSFVFMVVIPAIVTANTETWGVRSSVEVDGDVTARFVGTDGVVNLSYEDTDGYSHEISTKGDTFQIIRDGGNKITAEKVCDETPDWASPWTMGNCGTWIHIPKDYEITVK